MRRSIPSILVLLMMLSLMYGCAKRKESLSPDDEKLIPVYAGLLLLCEEYKASSSRPDSVTFQQRVDSILSGNGLTRLMFMNKMQVLAQSPPVFQQFSEKVRKDIEHRTPR